ncbi:uncharacterized protein LOC142173380 [Nicotiana tabacum]|uniref:Uncharacterized protein LOC142173380 n=1 Tax=Nicotiana tabacum TaxID=4097 RepID=A0AC58TCX0_TOBAC
MGVTDVDPKNPIVVGNSQIYSSLSEQVDPCHPYFLTSSDNPGVNLININFDGTNYANWRKGWQRCNDMVIAWLLNSRSRDIAGSVSNRIWMKNFRMNWRRSMVKQMTHNAKINEDQKLIQLLMGLNDAYFDAIESILMMKPLPSIAHAYSALLHQESQREVHSNSSSITDSTTFRTSGQKWNAQRTTNDYKSTNLSYNAGIKKNDLYCNYGKKNLGMLRKNTTYW